MQFAHFAHIWGKPVMSPYERYNQLWRELALCDGLGFDYGFCVEHHFRPDESWISSPSIYLAAGSAYTRRMRLGSMGYIVPLYHPLRLAEEIAICDQMLGGRMELGLVPGINADYFTPFGLDYAFRKSPTLEFVGDVEVSWLNRAAMPRPELFTCNPVLKSLLVGCLLSFAGPAFGQAVNAPGVDVVLKFTPRQADVLPQ